ncbi:MAG: hypothetical protein NZ553_17665 [Caldilinea sp.]|nr:hypothetical protein [Caldilinea sp.]MDW8442310.1 hypothetical protein [Caldilineaceae bacterium]
MTAVHVAPSSSRALLRAIRSEALIGTAMGLFAFVLLLLTSPQIGVTWDEPINIQAAEQAMHWFQTLGRGGPAAAFEQVAFGVGWGLNHEHPPLTRLITGVGWALTHAWLPAPLTHRVGVIALAAFSIALLTAWAAHERGLGVGVFAGAATLAMPRLFFHMHLAVLDYPVTVFWLLATLMFYHFMRQPRPGLRAVLGIGLGAGLALLTKITAVLLWLFWALWLVLYRSSLRRWLIFSLSACAALAVLIAGWPWVWMDPVTRLLDWIGFFRQHYEIRQWYAGQLYTIPPWHMPFVLLVVTTPAMLLLSAGIGVVAGWRGRCRNGWLPDAWIGLHLLGILTVLGFYALPFTTFHDQERLMLPAFVHLAVLAGEGFQRFWSWAPARRRTARSALGVALGILFLAPGAWASWTLHPFQLAYYNELIGGVRGAKQWNMETIYFASTYGHFLPELNRLPDGSRLWVMPNSWDVIYYYQRHELLRRDLVVLRPWGWGSFYDDAGVRFDYGGLADADYALIERRQTTFNDRIPEYAAQLEWAATKPTLARIEREGVVLASLHSRE